ncbi:MAG: Crp/Fnr family transcriptional regulator [Pseudomonadota bacterium]
MDNLDTLLKHFGKNCSKAEHVFYEGDPGNEIYLVHSGEIRIYKSIKDMEKTIAIMRKDDFFGEVAALTGTVRTSSALAINESVLIVIPVGVMEKIAEGAPAVAMRLLKRMAWRLKSADDMIAILSEKDPQVRIILGIIRILETEGEDSEDGISFHFDLDDFANTIEVEKGKIAETIGELARRRILEVEPDGRAVVRNLDDLGEFYRFIELAKKFGS